MGLIIASKQEIKDYFDSPAISQSRLKTLENGLDSFLKDQSSTDKQLYYSEKSHFIKGDGVDIKLTGNEEDFNEEFFISRLDSKPTDVEMRICHRVFDSLIAEETAIDDIGKFSNYRKLIQQAIEDEKWYGGNPGEKRTSTLIHNCTLYFDELVRSSGKQILSLEENECIDAVVDSFKTHPRTREYFDREVFINNPDIDVYLQLPIYFTYEGYDCKALLDILIVYKDTDGNITSLQPIDVKTMSGPTLNFHFSLKTRRYDIQAAWYTLALQSWLDSQFIIEPPVIMNFKFLVESTTQPGSPLVYVLDTDLLEIGKSGRPELFTNMESVDDFNSSKLYQFRYKPVKGYEQLMDEFQFYQENGIEEDIVVVQNEGIFKLDWNGIV